MRQIEITVRLTEKIEEAIAKLEKRGFKRIRESDIHDIYMSNLDAEIKRENIQKFLKHSVLLRNFKLEGKEIKKILKMKNIMNSIKINSMISLIQ